MMELVECVKKGVKLLPLFYEISVCTIKDSKKSSYPGKWSEWGVDGDEFMSALDTLLHMSGIENKEGLRPREFRRIVLEEIHKLAPPDIRPDVSDVCGGDRLVKVVNGMFAQHLSEESDESLTHPTVVLGLYGASGAGKSTLCKMLEHSNSESDRRLCCIQLDSTSELERMKKVLRVVTNLSSVWLDKLKTRDEARKKLLECQYDKKVFLIIDNVIPQKSMDEAKSYLRGRFKPGSKVLITANSETILSGLLDDVPVKCRHIDAMPDLEKEEATEILLKRAGSSRDLLVKDEQWKRLMERCLNLCSFPKCGERGEHYHPLVLNAVAESLSYYGLYSNKEEMASWMRSLESGFGNVEAGEKVLRLLRSTTYDLLTDLQKQVFLDVALYLPEDIERKDELFQWLHLVHGKPIREAVWTLLRRGLIDESAVSEEEELLLFPLMQNLYFEMATLIVEDKGSECLFIQGDGSDKDLPQNCQEMMRIGFEECRFPGDLVMSSFPSVQVLAVKGCLGVEKLDLLGAACLRSLELELSSRGPNIQALGLDDCYSLVYLHSMWSTSKKQWSSTEEVWSPSNQQWSNVSLPTSDSDMSATRKRRRNHFANLRWLNVDFETIAFDPHLDLSSLESLEVLSIQHGDLMLLDGDWRLQHPDLGALRNLRVFRFKCSEIFPTIVPVVFEFGNKIETIFIRDCEHVSSLRGSNHNNCTSLRELHLESCPTLREIEGFGEFMSLERLSLAHLGLTAFPRELLKRGKQLQHLEISDINSITPQDAVDVLRKPDLDTQFHLASIQALLKLCPPGRCYDVEGPSDVWYGTASDRELWEKTLSLVVESKETLDTISNLLQEDFYDYDLSEEDLLEKDDYEKELVLDYGMVSRLVLHLCVGGRYVHLEELLCKPHVIQAFTQVEHPFCLLLLALANQHFGADLESHASSIATMICKAGHDLDYFGKCAASIVSNNPSVAKELPPEVCDRVLSMMDSSYDVREQLQYGSKFGFAPFSTMVFM